MADYRFESVPERPRRVGQGGLPGRRGDRRRRLSRRPSCRSPSSSRVQPVPARPLAKSVAEMTGSRLIRLHATRVSTSRRPSYRVDDYKKQLPAHPGRTSTTKGTWESIEDDIFSDELPAHPAAARGLARGAGRASHRRGRSGSRSRPRRCCSRSCRIIRSRFPSSAPSPPSDPARLPDVEQHP